MVFESYRRPFTISAEPLPMLTAPSAGGFLGNSNNMTSWSQRLTARERFSLGSVRSNQSELPRYVASSTHRGKGLDMDALERRRQEREMAQRYRSGNLAGSRTGEWTSSNHSSFKARITRAPSTRQYGSNFLPTTAKQVYFVLNGQPSQIHRYLLNPARPPPFDTALEEVSRGLQIAIHRLYTYDGEPIETVEQLIYLKDNRVLAVPRNERLLLHGRSYSDLEGPLPPLRKTRDSSESSSGNAIGVSARRYDRRYNPLSQPQSNSIERPAKSSVPSAAITLPPSLNRRRYVSNLMQVNSKLEATEKVKGGFPQIPQQTKTEPAQTKLVKKRSERRKRMANVPPVSDAMQALVNSQKQTKKPKSKDVVEKMNRKEEDNVGAAPLVPRNSASNTADSDSGRPRSSNDFSNGGATTATAFHEELDADLVEDGDDEDSNDELEDHESADDYPEQPAELYEAEGLESRKERVGSPRVESQNGSIGSPRSVHSPRSPNHSPRSHKSVKSHKSTKSLHVETQDKREATRDGTTQSGRAETASDQAETRDGRPDTTKTLEIERQMEEQEEPIDHAPNMPNSSRQYGSEEEQAAVKIQAATRGFLTRQKYKVVKFQLDGPEPNSHDHRPGTPLPKALPVSEPEAENTSRQSTARSRKDENENDMENEEEREANKENELNEEEKEEAERVPSPKDEYQMDEPTTLSGADILNTKQEDENEEQDEADPENLNQQQQPTTETDDTSEDDEDDVLAKRTKGPSDVDSYSVTVKLGNRWAADSETELYIAMYGDKKESAKFYMRQKYVNWLESEHLNYVQQASDTFQMQIECGFLGIIRRLVIGHDSVGYGAGIFIDRIIITEDAPNGRAYLFQCHKWLDSGQVDGKLERCLRLTAYCDMDPIPHAMERLTHGRWEVVLHSGDQKGLGGTTSNLRLVGFGTRGSAEIIVRNEPELRQVPSKTLMQCHFKGIGELLKLRVEIDGAGESPDYFLEQIELRDLDTQDRCVVMCGKWLRWHSSRKGDQPFREFLTFRLGAEPLPLITYDGKLRVTPPQFQCIESLIRMELVGDIGETGIVLLDLDSAVEKGGKLELSFKIEAVSIGKLNTARLYMDPTEIGQQIYEGFSALQQLWEHRSADLVHSLSIGTTGNDWLTGTLYIREGAHTPYRYVLNASRIRPRVTDDQPFIKELRRSALEGMSTRMSKRKITEPAKQASWLLSVALGKESRLLPQVYLCGTKDTAQMAPISETPADNLLNFQLKDSDLGNICKVRLKTHTSSLLRLSEEEAESRAERSLVYIRKMRLVDNVNGDEIRFPCADVEMGVESIVEFPAFWPDRPPLPNIVYEAYLMTGASNVSPDVPIWLNIFGDYGDVSYRRLQIATEPTKRPMFSSESSCTFEFEAVSIGTLKTAEITVECDKGEFLWECAQLVIAGSLNGQSYVFQFSRAFTRQNNRQNASVSSVLSQ